MSTAPRRAVVATALALLTLAGCSSTAPTPPPAEPPATIGVDTSPNPGSVNTYWLSTPDGGVVVVDTSRNTAGGQRVADAIAATGRPVRAILLTHNHPDHLGGITALDRAFPDAPVRASEPVADVIRRDPEGLFALAAQFDADYPAAITPPDATFPPGADLPVGGTTLRTLDLGRAESERATVYFHEPSRSVFAGDLTNGAATPLLADGQTCAWLTDLDRLAASLPADATVYPGHGAPAPLGVQIADQRAYLQGFRDLVRPAVAADSEAGTAVGPTERASLVAAADRRFPNRPPVATLPDLVGLNVDGVGAELAREDPATLPATCRA